MLMAITRSRFDCRPDSATHPVAARPAKGPPAPSQRLCQDDLGPHPLPQPVASNDVARLVRLLDLARSSDAPRSNGSPIALQWHSCGMGRTRISTTVDADLLAIARRTHGGSTDAELIDEALAALLARYRSAEIDSAYETAYTAHPLDEPDEWGDLMSFRTAAAST